MKGWIAQVMSESLVFMHINRLTAILTLHYTNVPASARQTPWLVPIHRSLPHSVTRMLQEALILRVLTCVRQGYQGDGADLATFIRCISSSGVTDLSC